MNERDRQALHMLTKRCGSINGIMRFKGFAMEKAFDDFTEYLNGYKEFIVENVDPNTTREQIVESLNRFIEKTVNTDTTIRYAELDEFVDALPAKVEALKETVDQIKGDMILEEVDPSTIGDVTEFTERFIEKVTERHQSTIEGVLCENGFRNMAIPRKQKPEPEEPRVTFI